MTSKPTELGELSNSGRLTEQGMFREVPGATFGPVAEWFRGPQQVRGVGSSFTGEADMAMEVVLPDLYEAVIYVESTTRARPNPPTQP